MAVANVGGERRLRYEVADFAAVAAARDRKLGSHPPSIAGQRRATSPPPPTPALCFCCAVALVELHHAAEQFRHVAMRRVGVQLTVNSVDGHCDALRIFPRTE